MALATLNLQRFLAFLQTKRAGDLVSRSEILEAAGWAPASFSAYLSKRYTARFLRGRGTRFQILLNGDEVTESAVDAAFTQVKPQPFTPFRGWELVGEHGVYRLEERKGNGAVAQVWRCSTRGSAVQVAAKIASPQEFLLKELENVLRRFSRESRNPRELLHPNVIAYRDYGEIEGKPFLIMELADRSVADTLKTGRLALARSIEVVRCCALGLQYLHERGHIHRDVKPANMLELGDRIVLGDLGIVQWSDMNPEFISAETITRAAVQLGSYLYMSPEQRDDAHEVTPATDIYSLGISWLQLLDGSERPPDPAKIAKGKFTPATENATVADLIRRMVEFEPTDRPDVATLLAEISRISV